MTGTNKRQPGVLFKAASTSHPALALLLDRRTVSRFMPSPPDLPPRRIQRQIETLGHGLMRLQEAIEVLKRRVARGTVGDETLRAWLKPWLAFVSTTTPTSALIAWSDDTWRILSTGPTLDPGWLASLMLFRLPSLKSFWQRSLRASRLKRLQQVLPQVWPLDPTPLPPGSTIAGLGIKSWSDAPSVERNLVAIPASPDRAEMVGLHADAKWNARIAEFEQTEWHQLMVRIQSELWLVTEAKEVDVSNTVRRASWARSPGDRVVLEELADV